jgi:WD40 repeat protein
MRESRTYGSVPWARGNSCPYRDPLFAVDGRTALFGSQDKTLKLWEVATGKELRTFTRHADPVLSVAVSPDSRSALSGSSGTLKLWDLAGL